MHLGGPHVLSVPCMPLGASPGGEKGSQGFLKPGSLSGRHDRGSIRADQQAACF